MRDNAVALTGSERAWWRLHWKETPLCASHPMHQARAYFPVSVQPDLKCFQPDLWNARSSSRISEQHTSIFGSNATLYILIFLRFLVSLKDSALQLGSPQTQGSRKKSTTAPEIECLHFNKEHKKDQQKDDAHLQVFFQLH